MPAPTTVLEALKTILLGTTEITALVGTRIYMGQAPERTQLPLLEFRQDGLRPEMRFGTRAETASITFQAVAAGGDTAVDILKELHALFDPDSSNTPFTLELGVQNSHTQRIMFTNETLLPDPTRDPNGAVVNVGSLSYEMTIVRSW